MTRQKGREVAVPFQRSFVAGKEADYVTAVLSSGQTGSDGHFCRLCANLLESEFGLGKVFLTPSCTDALELAAQLALKPNDEVLTPSFAFPSTANAIVRAGAKPVFIDIRPDNLNIDEDQLQSAITRKTRAIMPIHYAGVGCNMDAVMKIARQHGLIVIEDAAQALGSSQRGRALGAIGDLAALSFHYTKNFSCGEGGALVVNSPDYLERAEILRDKGTNRARFMRGQASKYTWVDIGSSYVMSEFSAAILYGQLEARNHILTRRREAWLFYLRLLAGLVADNKLRLPVIPADCKPNFHLFFILLPDSSTRDELAAHLCQKGIQAYFHFVPLHSSPAARKLGYHTRKLPITEDLSGRLLRLPFHAAITTAEQRAVVSSIESFFRTKNAWPIARRVAALVAAPNR